jgi:hypothetical protein
VDYGAETLAAPQLVVATGGLSAPATGASGFGFELARQFGHPVVEPEPALVGLRWPPGEDRAWAGLSGVTLPEASVTCEKETFTSPLLLTHTGLSGPAILSASLYWRPGETLTVNLLPSMDVPARLREMRSEYGRIRLAELLAERLPRRFAERFAGRLLPAEPLARLSDAEITAAAERITAWQVAPAGTEGFERAEVTRGGVDTRELSSQTMESRLVPGLYFIGEVVDVTGRLGGYNLHWAWASAAAAGRAL